VNHLSHPEQEILLEHLARKLGARVGAACIGVLELLQLSLEAVLAGILPLIGITGEDVKTAVSVAVWKHQA
jgi:hypothetical protein